MCDLATSHRKYYIAVERKFEIRKDFVINQFC